MKTLIQGLLIVTMILINTDHSKAQSRKFCGETFFLGYKGLKKERAINLGRIEKNQSGFKSSSFQSFFNRTFKPQLSVDLLDGSGIHLFTISDLNFIPTINVGARIKAGIIITI